MNWELNAALISCLLLGLRHGFDYDHLAAISDITAVQTSWKRGFWLGLTYALGHAATVVALGILVIALRFALPPMLDSWTERLTGITLIVLALGVVASLLWPQHKHVHSDSPRIQSRLTLAINGVRWAAWRVKRVFVPEANRPAPFLWNYNGKSVFGIGILHGLGAETPTQLTLFLLAAQLGGTSRGLLGLVAFATGLVLMNALMTASLGGVFGATGRHPFLYQAIAWSGAVYSGAVGVVFLLGASGKLPALD